MGGNLPPGVTQRDIDAHHDGSAYGYEPPEELIECADCNGEGSWEEPAPSWDDPYGAVVHGCERCLGLGYFLEEKRPDDPNDCPYRHFTDEEAEAWERVFEGLP